MGSLPGAGNTTGHQPNHGAPKATIEVALRNCLLPYRRFLDVLLFGCLTQRNDRAIDILVMVWYLDTLLQHGLGLIKKPAVKKLLRQIAHG